MEESRPAQHDSHVSVLRPLMAGPKMQGKNVSMSWLKMMEGYEKVDTGKCIACIARRRDCRGGVPCAFCVTDHGLTAAYDVCKYPARAVPVETTIEKPKVISAGPSDEPRMRNRTSEMEKRRAVTLASTDEKIASGAAFRTMTDIEINKPRSRYVAIQSTAADAPAWDTSTMFGTDEMSRAPDPDVDMNESSMDGSDLLSPLPNNQAMKRPITGIEVERRAGKKARVSSPSPDFMQVDENPNVASHSGLRVNSASTGESSGIGSGSGSSEGTNSQAAMGFVRSRLAKGSLPAYPLAWQSQRGKPATSTFYDGFEKTYLDLGDPRIPSIKARFLDELEADRARWNEGEFKGKVAKAYAFQTEKTFKEDLGRE